MEAGLRPSEVNLYRPKTLDKAFEDASALLQEKETALDALVDALIESHKLDEAGVLEIISAAGCLLQRVS
ncbi:MAG: hypothetical protein ABJJ37_15035 [Roseibium sp.]